MQTTERHLYTIICTDDGMIPSSVYHCVYTDDGTVVHIGQRYLRFRDAANPRFLPAESLGGEFLVAYFWLPISGCLIVNYLILVASFLLFNSVCYYFLVPNSGCLFLVGCFWLPLSHCVFC